MSRRVAPVGGETSFQTDFLGGILKQSFLLLDEARLVVVWNGFSNGIFGQMAKDEKQLAADRGQRAEVGGQRSEVSK